MKPLTSLGLMSGTSMDGIDAAVLRTDGRALVEAGPRATMAYDDGFRARLRSVLGGGGDVDGVALELTHAHARLVRRLLEGHALAPGDLDVIGFHGHTVLHRPREGRTVQMGDSRLLAKLTRVPVVADFRSRDVAEGGEGAPLVPLYHAALCCGRDDRPLAVLNLGGVANVTWIGARCDMRDEAPPAGQVLAFDTGPGNALIDDWVLAHTGVPCDRDGQLARAGRVDERRLSVLLSHRYFDRPPPKSLDRGDFDVSPVKALSVEDGAATLTAFTAAAVARACAHFPQPPVRWLVSGGGRHNPALMAALREALAAPVDPVEAVGWDGDALEAQAFAYLAVRSLRGWPLTLPTTTGVRRPLCGGRLYLAAGGTGGAGPEDAEG